MQWNEKASFVRLSNFIVTNWSSGTATITNPSAAAFLSVDVVISTSGTLTINGMVSGVTTTEILTFTESGTQLTENAFNSILTLTPSWSSYNINMKAEDKQGQPVDSSTTYGPFLMSILDTSSQSSKDDVGVTGWSRGQWIVGYIQAFQPQINDIVTISRNWSGKVQDILPSPHINYPKGWQFLIVAT